ncbi:MAG: thioredoxin family protein [Thermaurantimonas sp.]
MNYFKILLLTVNLGITQLHAQSKVQWIKFSDLPAYQKKQKKLVFVDVYTNWCGPCKMLDAQTFGDPRVAEYLNTYFYPVKFNAEGNDTISFQDRIYINENYDPTRAMSRNSTHPFAGYFAIQGGGLAYPTTAYLDPDLMHLSQPVQGFLTPQKIEPILKYFGSKAYLTKNYQDFLKDFKPEWN